MGRAGAAVLAVWRRGGRGGCNLCGVAGGEDHFGFLDQGEEAAVGAGVLVADADSVAVAPGVRPGRDDVSDALRQAFVFRVADAVIVVDSDLERRTAGSVGSSGEENPVDRNAEGFGDGYWIFEEAPACGGGLGSAWGMLGEFQA